MTQDASKPTTAPPAKPAPPTNPDNLISPGASHLAREHFAATRASGAADKDRAPGRYKDSRNGSIFTVTEQAARDAKDTQEVRCIQEGTGDPVSFGVADFDKYLKPA